MKKGRNNYEILKKYISSVPAICRGEHFIDGISYGFIVVNVVILMVTFL